MAAPGPITQTRVDGNHTITVTATWTPRRGFWTITQHVDGILHQTETHLAAPEFHMRRLLDMKIE